MVKKKFDCKRCDGDGYVEQWEGNKKEEWLEIKDCDVCDGKGYLYLDVKDLREKSKKRKLQHRTEY